MSNYNEVEFYDVLEDTLYSSRQRKLKPGEFCHVERAFTKKGYYDFVGNSHINTDEDIAFIFKKLEEFSVENSFIVYVKENRAIIQHMCIGTFNKTQVNFLAIKEAEKRIQPDTMYLVHNHPSGNVIASYEDVLCLKSLNKMFGDKINKGIIINSKTGNFGVFGIERAQQQTKKMITLNKKKEIIPIPVFSFDKLVFNEQWIPPDECFAVHDLAKFISSQRVGDRAKINYLIIDINDKIRANIFSLFTEIKTDNYKELADDLIHICNLYAGNACVIFGDFKFSDHTVKLMNNYISETTLNEIKLQGVFKINGNNTIVRSYDCFINTNTKNTFIMEKATIIPEERFPYADLERLGVEKKYLGNQNISAMLNYAKTPKLVRISPVINGQRVELDARLYLKQKSDGNYTIGMRPLIAEPKLNAPLWGYKFSDEEKQMLRKDGFLDKTVELEIMGKKTQCYISIDRLTNDIIHYPVDKLNINTEIAGVKLSDQQIEDLRNGKTIHLKGMKNRNGENFEADVRVDADGRKVGFIPDTIKNEAVNEKRKKRVGNTL